ncbi:c-type cytochrome [Sphingobacterium chuzhouense]|nr:cytochrome c [Sphingobacterium chuzhouense]
MIKTGAIHIMLACVVICLTYCNRADHISAVTQVQRHEANWSDGLAAYEATWPDKFEIGKSADKSFIAKWDIDVRPDGKGLPKGEGRAKNGAAVYQNKCASCHGVNGYEGPEDKLVTDSTGRNTIGNYWPYATTIFDYVRRAMPFEAPGSLTDQEVYDITAYLLYLNGIIEEEFVITEKTLPQVEMPAKKRYVLDDRRGGPEIR